LEFLLTLDVFFLLGIFKDLLDLLDVNLLLAAVVKLELLFIFIEIALRCLLVLDLRGEVLPLAVVLRALSLAGAAL
jgi:hypothetical protein